MLKSLKKAYPAETKTKRTNHQILPSHALGVMNVTVAIFVNSAMDVAHPMQWGERSPRVSKTVAEEKYTVLLCSRFFKHVFLFVDIGGVLSFFFFVSIECKVCFLLRCFLHFWLIGIMCVIDLC